MINWGAVPTSSVLPFMFGTYGNSDPASITMSGLAVTDIEVYKGTSMTQRASDAGYALLDTDGIDIDGITGIHGFSIDTGDNTDAGFYAAGSFYVVVVSAITVDAKTVNFVAGSFRLRAADQTGDGYAIVNSGTHGNAALYALLNTELADVLAAVDTEVAAIKAVTDLLIAAHSEPTGVPAANATPLNKIGFVYAALRNKVTVTSSKMQFFDDADAALWEKDLSDDGTTYTETEGNAP